MTKSKKPKKPTRIPAAEVFAANPWPVGTLINSSEWRRVRVLVEWNSAPGGRIMGVTMREVKSASDPANVFQLKTLPPDAHEVGSDVCDECDGSGEYFIDGQPRACICSESQFSVAPLGPTDRDPPPTEE